MKRKEFERRYAKRSGITVEYGYDAGIFPAVKCECWDGECEGWRRRYEDDEPPKGEPCKRHRYGGYRSLAPSRLDGRQRCELICGRCGEGYMPPSAFMVKPIGGPIYDCPHPTFGPSRWHKDDPFVRACLVCGADRRFTPVRCIGGPMDGEIEPTLIDPEEGTGLGWRSFSTTRGQEPDENGTTVMFSYTLRFGVDGIPTWEGRSQAERALDAQAEVTT